MVLPPGMLEHNLQSNHDLDCVFQSPDGFLYVQGFRRDNVVQHIQDRVGPLPRLGWVADPDAASPITGISQPFVGALLVRNIAEVQLPLHLSSATQPNRGVAPPCPKSRRAAGRIGRHGLATTPLIAGIRQFGSETQRMCSASPSNPLAVS